MRTQTLEYRDGEVTLEGIVAYPNDVRKPCPAVLIAHAWRGRDEFTEQKAQELAQLGYIGFALDMYGKGVRGHSVEENSRLMQPFMDDRKLIERRMLLALEQVKKLKETDPQRIGAIGFCFGGLCALDLARSGAKVAGVVSFHGLLRAPDHTTGRIIHAKVLALHGYDDPMGPPEQLSIFAQEMTQAKANWEIDMYGHTVHAFTNPEAHDPKLGTVYNAQAAKRSWLAMQNFFKEVFAQTKVETQRLEPMESN